MSTLTQTLPDKIWPGRGTACLISGYAANESLLQGIRVQADGLLSSSTLLQLAAAQIDDCCTTISPRSCLLSGFTTLVKFLPVKQTKELKVEVRADFKANQSEIIDQSTIKLMYENPVSEAGIPGCNVVICMACWEPDEEHLKRQIESIKAQTLRSWHCIINDDASSDETWGRYREIIGDDSRFSLFRNENNLGFYRNFEVALSRVPENVDYVAMVDQDDDWYPEKLATTVAAFDEDTMLVYCDMRIIDEKGTIISETYWSGRKNNYRDADVLFLANTVTGAASVFRRNLMVDILPFPQAVGEVFHDHWIACVARCRGKLGYVDQALYDYYQYGNSVIGRCDFEARGMGQRAMDIAANVKYLGKAGKFKSWLLHKRLTALNVFHHEYLRLYLFAEILKIRLPNMQKDTEQGLRMFSVGWSAIFHLLRAHVRIIFRKETTDDAEIRLAAALFMFKLDRIYGRLFAGRIVKRHCRSLKN
ncbi:MAG: glycosyltransferase [Gammaproteobacteria bacterium]|nr:glycosyltransferase [Gammaproteobacteria bacterium]